MQSVNPGVMFGRYRLVEKLGSGGMAVVFRGVLDGPEGFARSVVIKRVRPEFCEDTGFVRMIVSEARVSAVLQHPGIVQVFELGQVNKEYYLAMEYVDGFDLISILRRCAQTQTLMPIGSVLYVIAEIAAALAYAHELRDEQGRALEIVHRDISPSNIMVTSRGAVKLLDFGIAKAASHVRFDRTRVGTIKGKLSYFSPEQAEGQTVDRRTDIFALGVVLHESLTLKRLFRGTDDFHTMRLVRDAKINPPSMLRPEIDADIDRVVMKMLAKDKETRYSNCDEVAAALAPLVHRLHGDAPGLRKFVTELAPTSPKREPLVADEAGSSTMPDLAPISDEEVEEATGLATNALESLPAPTMMTQTTASGEMMSTTSSYQPLGRLLGMKTLVGAAGIMGIVMAIGVVVYQRRTNLAPTVKQGTPDAPIAQDAIAGAQKTATAAGSTKGLSPVVPQPKPAGQVVGPTQAQPLAVAPHAASPAPQPEPSAVESNRVPDVTVTLRGPEGADLFIDGRKAGILPLTLTLAARSESRILRIQSAGFKPWVRPIGGDESFDEMITLEKKSRHSGSTGSSAHSAPARPSRPPAKAPKPPAGSTEPIIRDPFKNIRDPWGKH